MKKLLLLLALTFSTSVVFTSCRDDRSSVERAADDVGDAIDDATDELD
ncbi:MULTISPECIES: hypothetical protein [Antarcticibacterium]|nr:MULTISPECIES: hypothetical protein [Antarcticibacterium]